MKHLTESELRRLARDPKQYRRSISDAKQRGLYARPQRDGEVAWVARSQRNGEAREKVLGYWPRVSVEEARAACASFLLEERGIGVTWGAAAERYLAEQTQGLVSKRHIERILTRHFAELARVPLDDLRREQVSAIVSKFAAGKPDTAAKLLQKAKALTRWAAATGLCEIDRLSALDRRVLMPNFEPTTGQRVLTDDELRAIFADEFATGHLLRAQALTAARIGEVLAFDPAQISKDGVWQRPREMMKSDRAHLLPLSRQSLAQLDRELPVAITSSGVMQHMRRNYGGVTGFGTHDVRRTASARMTELGVRQDIVHRCLAHAPDKLTATYMPAPPLVEMRVAMQALADHLDVVLGRTGTRKNKAAARD